MFEFLMFPYKLIFDVSTITYIHNRISIRYKCISLNSEEDLGENYMFFHNDYTLSPFPLYDEEELFNKIIWTSYSYITFNCKRNDFVPTLGDTNCLEFLSDIDDRLAIEIKLNRLIFDRETKFEKLIR